jgi:hypothetical protein
MTTYKEIFGKYVKNYSSDPTADAEGQVWYNTTSGTFKSVLSVAGSWSCCITFDYQEEIFFSRSWYSNSWSVVVGGLCTMDQIVLYTEEYNGSGWAVGGNVGTARYEIASAAAWYHKRLD